MSSLSCQHVISTCHVIPLHIPGISSSDKYLLVRVSCHIVMSCHHVNMSCQSTAHSEAQLKRQVPTGESVMSSLSCHHCHVMSSLSCHHCHVIIVMSTCHINMSCHSTAHSGYQLKRQVPTGESVMSYCHVMSCCHVNMSCHSTAHSGDQLKQQVPTGESVMSCNHCHVIIVMSLSCHHCYVNMTCHVIPLHIPGIGLRDKYLQVRVSCHVIIVTLCHHCYVIIVMSTCHVIPLHIPGIRLSDKYLQVKVSCRQVMSLLSCHHCNVIIVISTLSCHHCHVNMSCHSTVHSRDQLKRQVPTVESVMSSLSRCVVIVMSSLLCHYFHVFIVMSSHHCLFVMSILHISSEVWRRRARASGTFCVTLYGQKSAAHRAFVTKNTNCTLQAARPRAANRLAGGWPPAGRIVMTP
jgi:hypothetical protein